MSFAAWQARPVSATPVIYFQSETRLISIDDRMKGKTEKLGRRRFDAGSSPGGLLVVEREQHSVRIDRQSREGTLDKRVLVEFAHTRDS